MESKFEQALVPGQYYHVYNRGNNGETIFLEPRNYTYFMRLYKKFTCPFAETYAYCLLKNHFHFLIRVKDASDPKGFQNPSGLSPSQQFGNLFNAYAKAINKAYGRTGSLFEHPFKRILIANQSHLLHLVTYIHQNPQKHGLVSDFRKWPYSSYLPLVSGDETILQSAEVLKWSGGVDRLIGNHDRIVELDGLEDCPLISPRTQRIGEVQQSS
jgi:REP element-mobilizing transposase RayT